MKTLPVGVVSRIGYWARRPARGLTYLTAVLLMSGIGAAPAHGRHGKHGEPPKAWLEAKSVCVFRLGSGALPHNTGELSAALREGWKPSLSLPDPSGAVVIRGGAYPAMDSMRIDWSGGEIRTPQKKDKIRLTDRVEQSLRVNHLEISGQPLTIYRSRLNLHLAADQANIAVERDRQGRPVMMLADARHGTLSFDVSRSDAEKLLLDTARETASKYGISIERMKLSVVPETPRSVRASLYVATKVAFIPAGMMFKAHVTVDPNMNATISGLTCDGDEALGPIIVGLLRPSLAKYDGQTKPLVSFPAGRLQLRDVAVRVEDGLHLTAAFGN